MERTGFKRQQTTATAAGTFREHPDGNFAFLKGIRHFRNSTVRFRFVITVDQQVASQPVQQTKERNPNQALFADRYGWRLDDVRRRHHIVVVLVVGDINRVAIVLRVSRFAGFNL